ncbi:hypothetical protein CDAR_449001 [Caerostris darwini]|uniref:Uncharacterized protein n=1 Tax=Caerostris darwini TaxID=1538125 RepID=A0AAV4P9L3_9ARAC|nr:hypothetical protein CDAR_449001 [Caerostris darwini]
MDNSAFVNRMTRWQEWIYHARVKNTTFDTERHPDMQNGSHCTRFKLNSNMKFRHVTNDAGIIGERLREQGLNSRNTLILLFFSCAYRQAHAQYCRV